MSSVAIEEFIVMAEGYFKQCDYVEAAVLFGSFAEGVMNTLSDVDIGILAVRDISLIEIGCLTSGLESLFKRNVDVIILNGLQNKNPALAYEIATKGKALYCKERERFVEFKTLAVISFIDTAPLREAVGRGLRERLRSGRFGERNYAG